jgi:hypothetical protein
MRRRLMLIGGIATLGGAFAVLAKPALDGVRRSLRTSSSPGVGVYGRVAGATSDEPACRRHRGFGPLATVWRVELTAP